jgi:hypothetical protein
VFIILVLLLVLPLPFKPEYWWQLYWAAAEQAWMAVFERGWGSLAVLLLLWIAGIWREHQEKWSEQVKLEALKVFAALKVPVAVFVLVFLVHLFGITPARMVLSKPPEATASPTAIPVDVRVTSENKDQEAREMIQKAEQQLKQVADGLQDINAQMKSASSNEGVFSVVGRRVQSNKPDLPHALEITVNFKSEMSPFGVGFTCDKHVVAQYIIKTRVPLIHRITSPTEGVFSQQHAIEVLSPRMTPSDQVIIRLFGKESFKIVESGPWKSNL